MKLGDQCFLHVGGGGYAAVLTEWNPPAATFVATDGSIMKIKDVHTIQIEPVFTYSETLATWFRRYSDLKQRHKKIGAMIEQNFINGIELRTIDL